MGRWWIALLMAQALVFAQLLPASAEQERKSLEQILVEKGVISKGDAESVRGIKLAEWIDGITFSGDLRLRHESFWKDPDVDRHRQRFRLRFGPEIRMQDLTVGIRLASGVGEQFSTNQSFDNLSSQKALWIDRAYLQWRARGWLTVTGGRMPNPFFTVYTTDAVWDEDVNPEGVAENINVKLSDTLALFANLGQFVLDEDAAVNRDQWLFGQQVGGRFTFTKATRAAVAVTYYNYTNETLSDFGQTTFVLEGNTRVGTILVNQFKVLDLTAEFATELGGLPVNPQVDLVKNLADTTTGEDKGYQAGIKLGRAAAPGSWELAYFYKLLETDAVVADLADADFGDGGTNRRGHIVWGAYNFTKALQFKTKFFQTKVENESLPPGRDNVNRLQVDLVTKF